MHQVNLYIEFHSVRGMLRIRQCEIIHHIVSYDWASGEQRAVLKPGTSEPQRVLILHYEHEHRVVHDLLVCDNPEADSALICIDIHKFSRRESVVRNHLERQPQSVHESVLPHQGYRAVVLLRKRVEVHIAAAKILDHIQKPISFIVHAPGSLIRDKPYLAVGVAHDAFTRYAFPL